MTSERLWEVLERAQAQIAAEVRHLLGEAPYDERIFTPEERARRIGALKLCAAQQTSDAKRHASWMQMHLDHGWKYGPEFDPGRKLHPNLLPWDELPVSTRVKARVFAIIAQAGAELDVPASPCAPS